MLPISGSAYSYAYATLGELVAWIIGWDLNVEYALAASAVAVGWSGYASYILMGFGIEIPTAIAGSPGTLPGAVFNLPAFLILLLMTALLVVGIRESARANAVIVSIKLFVVFLVIAVGGFYVTPDNCSPFAPFGMQGVVTGAATVFFTSHVNRRLLDLSLGFAAGVMIAASFWSLLAPSIALAREMNMIPWLPAVVGFLLGGGLIRLADAVLPHLHLFKPLREAEGTHTASWGRSASGGREQLCSYWVPLERRPGATDGGQPVNPDGRPVGESLLPGAELHFGFGPG